VREQVFFQAGYRCSNPRCSSPWLLDAHHIKFHSLGGAHTLENLIALCPNCHRLVHEKKISQDALKIWKLLLTSGHIHGSQLRLFLTLISHLRDDLRVSFDAVLRLSDLIGAGLVQAQFSGAFCGPGMPPWSSYYVSLTPAGAAAADAYACNDLDGLREALAGLAP
jgi:hypothetical protein